MNGFTYGEHGDFHALSLPAPEQVPEEEPVVEEEEDKEAPVEKESLE